MDATASECSDNFSDIRASEVYPKRPLLSDSDSLSVPFSPLPGEGPEYLGCTSDGIIALSNYRVYLSVSSILNIPLRLIDQIECRDIFFLYIHCKDGRSIRCTFSNNDECQKWYKRLQYAITPPAKLEDLFSFAYYLWSRDEHKELYSHLNPSNGKDYKLDSDISDTEAEAERMGFDLGNVWKISNTNVDYKLCPSYPQHWIVPASVMDHCLEEVAKFRYSQRIPVIVWRHQQNGSVIARSSQPQVGWFGYRNEYDEKLFQAIADACSKDPGCDLQKEAIDECCSLKSECDEVSLLPSDHCKELKVEKKSLLIIDARSYTAAVANRAKGGGCECPEYYPNCEVEFMSLANIHSIRKSFSNIRTLCISTAEQQNWLSLLENTRWLQNISGLIRASLLVVNAVDVEKRPVLVHCSDGWDRTPQIVALAELMLDPYYRSRKGFQVLVEREWLDFGHKFADRCGHSTGCDDPNERSPVFLQWLDCVHQLLHQFPCHFEFNQQYLVKLVHHTYSCLFGTFLCNSSLERRKQHIQERTFSIWTFLNSTSCFLNYLFNNSNEVLRPSCQIKDLRFWNEVYLPTYSTTTGKNVPLPPPKLEVAPETTGDGISLVKTKSCDNIFAADHSSTRKRRCSDPSIIESNFSFAEGQSCQLQHNNAGEQSSIASSKDCLKALDLDNNGNPNVENTGCENSERTNTSETSELCQSTNLTAAEPSIDGSTDTLVSEAGVSSQEHVKDSTEIKEPESDSVLFSKLTVNASTSTTEISNSCASPLESDGCLRQIVKSAEMHHGDSWCQSLLDDCDIPTKKSTDISSSSGSHYYTTPHHSRTPSSGFPATPCDDNPCEMASSKGLPTSVCTLDIDGLIMARDEVQEQIRKLVRYYKTRMKSLKDDLWIAQYNLCHQKCQNCQGRDGNYMDGSDDGASLADSACSGEQHIESSAASDVSWEQVEEQDALTTLWVPDHAASHCMGCEAKFWTGRRKHHCRKCGRVFCANCSSQMVPVPSEQLFHPVRVCFSCFEELQPQCRQAAVSCDKLPKPVVTAAST